MNGTGFSRFQQGDRVSVSTVRLQLCWLENGLRVHTVRKEPGLPACPPQLSAQCFILPDTSQRGGHPVYAFPPLLWFTICGRCIYEHVDYNAVAAMSTAAPSVVC